MKVNRLTQYVNERGNVIEEHQPIDMDGPLRLPNGDPFYLLNVTAGVRTPRGVQPIPVKVKLDGPSLSDAITESLDGDRLQPKVDEQVTNLMRAHQAQQRGTILAPG